MSDFNSLVQYTVENISRPIKYIIYKLTEFIRVVDKFIFRQVPAGVASGYANIEKVEGNTVKFNQLVSESRLVSSGTQNGLTIQRDGFNLSITGTPLSTSTYINIFTYPYIPIISGHKFYIHVPPTNSTDVYFWLSGGEWLFFSRIITVNSNNITANLRVIKTDINVNIDGYIQIIDLTAIFGSGNEPSTVVDFEAWMAQNGLPSVAAYNAGELLSVKMSGMQTENSSQQTLDTIALDVTTITGINTATNVREIIFPDGMKSAKNIADVLDLVSDIAIKKLYRINLGNYNYIYDSQYAFFQSYDNIIIGETMRYTYNFIIQAPYFNNGYNNSDASMLNAPNYSAYKRYQNGRLFIKNTNYTNGSDLKTSLNGVYLIAERQNYITYTDLQDANGNPLNPRYKMEQGGTEQVLPVNTSTPTTVAPTLTTVYTKDVH